jgi:single-strand DNA-binding protein
MTTTIHFLGTLGSDPETGTTPNGTENLKFRAAVNTRHGQNENTTWYSVTAWSGTAKGLTTLMQRGLLAKGARVVVSGTLTSREYTDRNGQTRTSLDVNANNVELVNPPKNAAGPRAGLDYNDIDALNELPF